MNPADNERATAKELVSFAEHDGFDLESLRNDSAFQKDGRWIVFWRKDEFPYSGPVNEAEGTLHYSMQGSIATLPEKLKDSAPAFRGGWTEAGTLESIEQALELVKAWLLDKAEVDGLPTRSVTRYGV